MLASKDPNQTPAGLHLSTGAASWAAPRSPPSSTWPCSPPPLRTCTPQLLGPVPLLPGPVPLLLLPLLLLPLLLLPPLLLLVRPGPPPPPPSPPRRRAAGRALPSSISISACRTFVAELASRPCGATFNRTAPEPV